MCTKNARREDFRARWVLSRCLALKLKFKFREDVDFLGSPRTSLLLEAWGGQEPRLSATGYYAVLVATWRLLDWEEENLD